MEGLMEAIGAVALTSLVVIGLVAGFIAGKVEGRNMALYLVVGVMAAVAVPFVLAAMGIGVLAAGSLLLLLVVATIGAVLVLIVVRALLGRQS